MRTMLKNALVKAPEIEVMSTAQNGTEAQEKIRETILNERRQDALATFKKRVRQGASIWTAYDEQDRQQQRISERRDSRPTHRFNR